MPENEIVRDVFRFVSIRSPRKVGITAQAKMFISPIEITEGSLYEDLNAIVSNDTLSIEEKIEDIKEAVEAFHEG